jgi:uncharacterized protein (DUF488 family)
MGTREFDEALEKLVGLAGEKTLALLCAEAVPWRCHRSLIADALTLRGIPVRHITSRAAPSLHRLSDMAEVEGGRLVYRKQS